MSAERRSITVTFSKKLMQIRNDRGQTKVDAAKAAGISLRQYAYLETGHSLPTMETLCWLAWGLQVNPWELMPTFEDLNAVILNNARPLPTRPAQRASVIDSQ